MEPLKTFLFQNYAKLRDLFLSMTLGNRIVASLLVATLIVSLGYLIVGSIPAADPSGKTTRMFDGYQFSPKDKGAADLALSKAGLTDYNWIGNQLQVPTHKKGTYAMILADAQVPEKGGTARFDMVESINPWHAARTADAKMLAAKEKDFADAIRGTPGIASAEIFTNKRPSWDRNVWARTQITSVGVTLEAIENKPLRVDTIGAIGHLAMVTFGILDKKDISIYDRRHCRTYNGAGEEQNSSQTAYLRHLITYQEECEKNVYDLLSSVEGLTVKASVDLTKYEYQESFLIEHGRPTILVNHTMDYQLHKEGYSWFGRPGQIAQFSRTQIDPTANVSPKDVLGEKKSEQETTNALQGTETKQGELPFIPQRMYVTISVPRDHILALWKEKNRQLGGDPNTTPQPDELLAEEEDYRQETKRKVAPLLKPYLRSAKEDPLEYVEVTYTTRFLPTPKVLTSWEQFVLFMQHNWQSLGLMSLVFCGLGVLWAISNPPRTEPIVIYEGLETPLSAIDARIAEKKRREEEAAATAAAAEATAVAEQEELENSLGELGSLRSLKDEIAELIARNPDAAAAVLRQWIGNAMMVEAKS